MKALSIKQPWAWLIVNGIKPVENRDWYSNYRGPLLIHAGKTIDEAGLDWLMMNSKRLGFDQVSPNVHDISVRQGMVQERGGIVGRVEMTKCTTSHDSPFFFGPYGFIMEKPEVLPFIPYRGQLKIFEIPDSVLCR